MFTGIITQTAKVIGQNKTKKGLLLTFKRPNNWRDIKLGESIATDGVCLTVSKLNKNVYSTFLMPETLKKSSFGTKIPPLVNLERSMLAADRFGGHFVQGHVDARGQVKLVQKTNGHEVFIEFPLDDKNLVIYKGSITINGVSLTVASVKNNILSVALIPHTLKVTTFSDLKTGDVVNLEYDVLGKYVQKIIAGRKL